MIDRGDVEQALAWAEVYRETAPALIEAVYKIAEKGFADRIYDFGKQQNLAFSLPSKDCLEGLYPRNSNLAVSRQKGGF
jgi:hypothetical protein